MNHQWRRLDTDQIEPRPVLEEITVVIPTLGRPILEECLWWIAAGSAWPGGLIVVDQGGIPEVEDWIAALRSLGIDAQYVPSSQRGRAAGLNRGLELVTTRFVAVTDDDCFVSTDWVKRILDHLTDDPESIITGRVEAAGEGVLVILTARERATHRRPRLRFDCLSGGNVGFSMSVINRVGLFDESPCLRTAEDAELAYRALRAGVPIIYAPDIVVQHYGWRDEGERLLQYQHYARSHGGFYGKYLRQGDWFIALRAAAHHARALRRCVRGLLTGDQEQALCGWCYLTGLLPGIIAGMDRDRMA